MKLGSLGLLRLVGLIVLLVSGCASPKLKVESDPSGGTVFINDAQMGVTPVTLKYSDLPYLENLTLRIQKQDYTEAQAIVQGPRLAGLGEQVKVKLSRAPDEAAKLNAQLERVMTAHRMALENQYGEAERIINQLIAESPELIAPRLLKGAIFLMSKNYPPAIDTYQEILKIEPSNPEAIRMLEFLNAKGGKAR